MIEKDNDKAILTQHQKFHKAQVVTQQLATLCSEVGMDEFQERLTLISVLKDEWAKGEKVSLSVKPAIATCKLRMLYP